MKVGNGERVERIDPERFKHLKQAHLPGIPEEAGVVHIPPEATHVRKLFVIGGILAAIIGGGFLLLRKRA